MTILEYWEAREKLDEQKEAHEDNASYHSEEGNDLDSKEEEYWEAHEKLDEQEEAHESNASSQFDVGNDLDF